MGVADSPTVNSGRLPADRMRLPVNHNNMLICWPISRADSGQWLQYWPHISYTDQTGQGWGDKYLHSKYYFVFELVNELIISMEIRMVNSHRFM